MNTSCERPGPIVRGWVAGDWHWIWVVIAWGLLGLQGLIASAGAASTAVRSSIRFLDSTRDLGRIAPQQRIPLILAITNAGPSWVELTNIGRSCSCVSVEQWTRRIGPGGTGRVEVLFYAPEQVGPISEHVTLQGQPGGDNLASLEMIGQVWQPIEAKPGFVSFSSPGNAPVRVQILNHLDEPVEISAPVNQHTNFRTTLKPLKAGREYQLIIEPVPPFPNANTFARLRLKTSSEVMRELAISVFMPASSPAKEPPTPHPKAAAQ